MFGIRKFLMKSSYPPFMAMVLITSLGLILLLEETILVPRSFRESGAALRENPADFPAEIILGKRVSSIRKVEDFIMRRAPLEQDRHFIFEPGLETIQNISFLPRELNNKSLQFKGTKYYNNDMGLILTQNKNLGSEGEGYNSNESKADSASLPNALKNTHRRLHGSNGTLSKTKTSEDKIQSSNGRIKDNVEGKNHRDSSTLSRGKKTNIGKNKLRKNEKSSFLARNAQAKAPEHQFKRFLSNNTGGLVLAAHLGDKNSSPLVAAKQKSKLYNKIMKQFTLKGEEDRDSFINLHRYGYVFDSNACDIGKPKFAILVHSKFNNFIKRAKIRNTYAKNKTASGVDFAVTFILGKPNIEELTMEGYSPREDTEAARQRERERRWEKTLSSLAVESKIFKDIVMGNFTDSYRNLTIKHILAYDWVLKRCKDLLFVLKVDDDILVNTYRVARLVRQAAKTNENKGILVCDVPWSQKVMRGNQMKWFVSHEEYPFRYYPPWCKGYGVFMTTDVVRKLYRASSDIRNFWIDDVYVTGILALRAGIQVLNFRHRFATVTHNTFEPGDIHALFVWANFDRKHSHRIFWKDMVAAQYRM
ncbi:beta-1,3-galactosyltransferase 1 [Plakobranchus ocellatus]|uniref:Beta-1,3-galactosyltransferase 1 n=1 Tax=Plakobranchus ocellatus TaxID=259542 RepID=A0AAV4CBD4_9GAST|nr:beta-1,3-galactosyltransferase 1 [Plakobranchus ocellatus]